MSLDVTCRFVAMRVYISVAPASMKAFSSSSRLEIVRDPTLYSYPFAKARSEKGLTDRAFRNGIVLAAGVYEGSSR
ncbi:hypothetical protein [uncultured Bifidobacterium sp.]|uniref:hypothetical protein n=1 Tax=uncultured Bifidobacterium sp. TaxID=165187 RepID=UPI002612074D|nr:hypothetical protein [uncultured Bifidobacterium sp.]